MLACDEAALAIERVSVWEQRGGRQRGGGARGLVPAHGAIVGDITENEAPWQVAWSLDPRATRPQALAVLRGVTGREQLAKVCFDDEEFGSHVQISEISLSRF